MGSPIRFVVLISVSMLFSLTNCLSLDRDLSRQNVDEENLDFGEQMKMKQKRPEFMGNAVSIPQYMRLINLQNATIDMDKYMKNLAKKFSPKVLMADPSWRELVLIYRSLEKLLPDEIREIDREVVWWN